ncbi:carbohydrate ABC transporter permease [Alicyclobacillus fodiniaquatilis]|uniref:Carbohydrate ABC transporter permease n=1 Tax=Alicyclobacillus fodiniaquatilis TaxID=1661150 RepID=A0ABW4JK39_9BACL
MNVNNELVGKQIHLPKRKMPITMKKVRMFIGIFVLCVLSLAFLVPFLYMIGTSFKPYAEIAGQPLNPFPLHPTMQNITHLLSRIPFWRQFANSLIISLSVTILAIVFNSLVAFGFARYDFKWKNGLFIAMLITMMVPAQLTIVPSFMMFRSWHWLNTFWPLILPGSVSAFSVFLIRQIMVSIPREMYDSARVDGCSEFGTYLRIAFPLARSAIGIVGILTFMGSWNDYIGPLIYLSSESRMTLAVGITTLNNPYKIDFASPITGAFLMSIPVLIALCIVGQKYFVNGVTAGAVKG